MKSPKQRDQRLSTAAAHLGVSEEQVFAEVAEMIRVAHGWAVGAINSVLIDP